MGIPDPSGSQCRSASMPTSGPLLRETGRVAHFNGPVVSAGVRMRRPWLPAVATTSPPLAAF
jgi:hypothetical protein